MRAVAIALCVSTAVSALATGSNAAGYPDRPVRIIVPSAPGGQPDISARLIADHLGKQIGQAVFVENRPGASGIIGFEAMAKAPPDGYTIGYASFLIATNPGMFSKLPYDALRDFEMVIHQVSGTNLLTVSPALEVTSVHALIEHARANPGRLSFGSSGHGASQHLSMELFRMMTNTRLVHVPYKAIQQAITEAISGELQIVCDNVGSILPHVKMNRLRGLGVTASKRSPAVPELPTIAEAGVPGYEMAPWSGYVVPARTAREIVARLNHELNKALLVPAVIDKLTAMGATPIGGTPEQFADHMRKEMAKWDKVINAMGVRPE